MANKANVNEHSFWTVHSAFARHGLLGEPDVTEALAVVNDQANVLNMIASLARCGELSRDHIRILSSRAARLADLPPAA